MMEAKDQRVNLVNQVLSGIRVVKLYNWQDYFQQKIEGTKNS